MWDTFGSSRVWASWPAWLKPCVVHVVEDAVGRCWCWAVGWRKMEAGGEPIRLLVDALVVTADGFGPTIKRGGGQNRATLFLTQSVYARSTQPFGLARFSQQSFSSHSTPPSHSSAARCSSSSHCGRSFTPQTFSSTLARQLPLTPQFVKGISPGLACWQSIWFHLNCSIQIRTDLCLHGHAASNSPWNHNMLLLFPALAAGWWTHAGLHESTVCLLDDVAQSYAR